MYSQNRSARRYRWRRSGWARVAAQLAAPVVLGLLIGGVLAFQAGSSNNMTHPAPLGAVATPTPSFGHHAQVPATVTPGWIKPPASATASATTTTTPAPAG